MTEQSTILVADDDRSIRVVLEQALSRLGHDVRTTDSGKVLWELVEAGEGDLVITDVVMPDVNGLDLVPRIRSLRPDLKVIVMSAQNTLLTAIKAAERGAFEYLPKPFDLDELASIVERANAAAKETIAETSSESKAVDEKLRLIGRSPAMQEIYRTVARLMTSDLTVMIMGESGTGKELVARALHEYGKRKQGPFVALNMAAIPRELVESELFGHEKGAFTGATSAGVGRFKQAQNGTLFLDEIGDMPLDAQTRLLRVLQEGEFTTVGGRVAVKADVRIIAATHRDLHGLIEKGQFREDLFYRLNVVPIRLPPLRERKEDIADLVRHFLEISESEGLGVRSLDTEAMEGLHNYDWPGNVRELENLIRRVAALYTDDIITSNIIRTELDQGNSNGQDPAFEDDNLSTAVERHLSRYFDSHRGSLPSPGLYERVLKEMEKPLISLSLTATKGNQIKTAKMLGINRNTLRKKIKELDIDVVRGTR
ncbi:MAG: nitrogen regulation protein NR(I) [Rhodospirillaceae bacterium]|nr:nitrogen regulation protein NR(I) [Rhodospirillaceae bacterium]|tara:strand:- start:18472 stop:19920 length:1449 start_codon:yes stop_codon:yes gene_type:complete